MANSPYPPLPPNATEANCHHGKWDSDKLVCRCEAGWHTDPNQDILSGKFNYCAAADSANSGNAPNVIPGKAHASRFNINSAVFTLMVVGGLLLIGALVLCYCCFCRHRRHGRHYRRSTEVVYSEAPHNADRVIQALEQVVRAQQQQQPQQPQPQQQQPQQQPQRRPRRVTSAPPRRAQPLAICDRAPMPSVSTATTRVSRPLQPLHPQVQYVYYDGNYLPHSSDAAPLQMSYSSGESKADFPPVRVHGTRVHGHRRCDSRIPSISPTRRPVAGNRLPSREPVEFASGESQEREPTYVVTVTPPLMIKKVKPARAAYTQG